MNYPFRYAVNSLLLNNRGKAFADSEFILGIEPRRNNRTARLWFEVDCHTDSHPVCQETGTQGVVEVWGAVGSCTSAVFDIENDGDLDIVTGEFNDRPMVLVSNLSDRRPEVRYVKIDLIGDISNRDGLGAEVRVYADSLIQTKVYNGKSGYLSQSSYPLYFGLGEADAVDRIEITWPSGHRQHVSGPFATNQLLEVIEGESESPSIL